MSITVTEVDRQCSIQCTLYIQCLSLVPLRQYEDKTNGYCFSLFYMCKSFSLFPLLQPPFYSRDVSEMYDGILHKPLPLPLGRSEAICSLLVGLLQKDQHRRLGAIADFVSVLLQQTGNCSQKTATGYMFITTL